MADAYAKAAHCAKRYRIVGAKEFYARRKEHKTKDEQEKADYEAFLSRQRDFAEIKRMGDRARNQSWRTRLKIAVRTDAAKRAKKEKEGLL